MYRLQPSAPYLAAMRKERPVGAMPCSSNSTEMVGSWPAAMAAPRAPRYMGEPRASSQRT